jgi:type III pantothenate kinase
MSVLVIDAGNTSTSLARYEDDGRISARSSVRGGLLGDRPGCEDAVRRAIEGGGPDCAMMASVTPRLDASWQALVRNVAGLELRFVRHDTPSPVRIGYPHPESTGADRIANVAAAAALYGTPSLVVDIGTAVTYDVVSPDAVFFTGVIGPGPDILARSLHDYTALLPVVEWWNKRPPERPEDTEGAMLYGIEAGFCGAIRETVTRLLPLAGPGAKLVATGGFAPRFVAPLDMGFIIDVDLTLKGVGILATR